MLDGTLMLKNLDDRRRELGLSYELLSKRSGVSRPTVQRILSGHHAAASFANIVAIARSLGLGIRFDSTVNAHDLEREQAERGEEARRLGPGNVRARGPGSGSESSAVDGRANNA